MHVDDGDLDKSNQIAGFDARLNLNHWFELAFMGNMSVKMKQASSFKKCIWQVSIILHN
jgi:hypothetical protein